MDLKFSIRAARVRREHTDVESFTSHSENEKDCPKWRNAGFLTAINQMYFWGGGGEGKNIPFSSGEV